MFAKLRLLLAALALVAVSSFATSQWLQAQQEPDGQDQMDPAMMAQMMAMGTPGKEHKVLTRSAGEWDDKAQMRMSPGADWTEIPMTTSVKTLLGGRFIQRTIKGNFAGMPWEGIHILGYDKLAKEYVSFWMDSFGTWFVQSKGQYSEESKTLEMKGAMRDVISPDGRPFRQVIRIIDEDHSEVEMYDTIPPAGEVMVMKVKSTRVK
ncbi:MAG: DUF1579 domain-containing protein [Planctomycetota bacterium]|nr:MAG: DUF1579 domain-containing protein [Planctomycetota bacterium]